MKKYIVLVLFFLPMLALAQVATSFPMVHGIPVVHQPKVSGIYLGTPSIVILKNGDYLAANDFFGPACKADSVHIYRSDDKGKSWRFVTKVDDTFWAGLFRVDRVVYLLGVKGSNRNLTIRKSTDEGATWSEPYCLKEGRFHGSSTPVLFANGRIYKGYDHLGTDTNNKWMSGNRSFIMSASDTADLTDPASWSYTDEVVKPAEMDGTGWLETNAVAGTDGKVKGITRVANESGLLAGFYSLASDTLIDPMSVSSIPFIGGATKFNIQWDEKTGRYWSLSNYPPDVLRQPKMRAGGMRSVLALVSSPDLKTWTINAVVLASDDVKYHGFQYVDWQFEGKDIIFLSRTAYDDGLGGADNAHNSNFITFHRIKNYKRAKTPAKYDYLLSGIACNNNR